MHGFINTWFFFEIMVVDYLRAATCGATSSKTVTIYNGGDGRPDSQYMVVDYVRGLWPQAGLPCIKNPSASPKRYARAASDSGSDGFDASEKHVG
jgi:hypothetical protein